MEKMNPERPAAALAAALGPEREALLRAVGALASGRGTPSWLVGGAVRDVLLGRPAGDLDVVFEGPAPTIGRALAATLGGSLQVHEAFGTAAWTTPGGEVLDLVTARSERYPAPAALPAVRPAELGEDLARRDFSINAMAMSLSPQRWAAIADPLGGRADLDAGLLRALHPRSFVDDPTRAWRGARFAGRLGLTLDPETRRWLEAARDGGDLERLGLERLGHELELLLAEADPVPAFERLAAWRLTERIHPALAGSWLPRRLGQALRAAGDREALWLVLAERLSPGERAALERIVPGGRARRRRWLRSRERLEAALEALDRAAALPATAPAGRGRRAAIGAALSELDAAERAWLRGVSSDPSALDWWERTGRHLRPALDGRDLMARGFARGPSLGRALAAARRAAWDGGDIAAQLDAARAAAAQ